MVHTENTLLYNSNVRMKPNNQDIKKKAKLELMPCFATQTTRIFVHFFNPCCYKCAKNI